MSCNDYIIELIATQLVILENNTANTAHRAKNTQPLGLHEDC
jgi:hypothetical protein